MQTGMIEKCDIGTLARGNDGIWVDSLSISIRLSNIPIYRQMRTRFKHGRQ